MITRKSFDRLAVGILLVAVCFSLVLFFLKAQAKDEAAEPAYASRLFDSSRVHTMDIVMGDVDTFLETASDKTYTSCTLVIDGEAFHNVGLRGKGNYSMRIVSMSGSSRHSFKAEFDHYDKGGSYYGLDKLSLNNLNQDNTYMKDYVSYELMRKAGVPSPLCSYVFLTVNGEDFGLYLATEGIEDAFIARNFGNNNGKLYKPDASAGGGFGGGGGWHREDGEDADWEETDWEDVDWETFEKEHPNWQEERVKFWGMDGGTEDSGDSDEGGQRGAGMSTDDVKLKYIDDAFDSYSAIFDNAKSDLTDADKRRLIHALKTLGEREDVSDAVDTEEVIRYFAVHNFLCNDDSYTGPLVHNYYLYEENGRLSMIPWDYNLAFATFGTEDAKERINTPVDTPVKGSSTDDRPMFAWIAGNSEYREQYHEVLEALVKDTDFADLISTIKELIAPYVEKDPTKFCTTEEFEKGCETLTQFCTLRAESVKGQLNGTIPSITKGQGQQPETLIDTSLNLTDMGVMESMGF